MTCPDLGGGFTILRFRGPAFVTCCQRSKMRSERAIRKAANGISPNPHTHRHRVRGAPGKGVARVGYVEVQPRASPRRTKEGAACPRHWSQVNHASGHHAPDARSWRAFRSPDPLLEPPHGAVHLRRARQDPHHQPREDAAAVHRRDELPVGPRAEARHDPVRRHQALGARCDQGRSRPLRHAVRRAALARRHADQLPHGQGVDLAPQGTRADGDRRQLREAGQARSAAARAASARSSRSRSAASRT